MKPDFFRPITYDNILPENQTAYMKFSQKVDNYFYLGGKKTVILSDLSTKDLQFRIDPHKKPSFWNKTFKIASYFTLAAPLVMLMVKGALRAHLNFNHKITALPMHKKGTGTAKKATTAANSTLPKKPVRLPTASATSKSPLKPETAIKTYIPLDPAEPNDLLVGSEVDCDGLKAIQLTLGNTNVYIQRQNILDSGAEVIVNAANQELRRGGGVDEAIHLAGGRTYATAHAGIKQNYPKGYVNGHAVMIGSGDMQFTKGIQNVIVVAGPKHPKNSHGTTADEKNQLYSCYYNSLVLAHKENKKSIAFPSISTGVFNFPLNEAAPIALKAIKDFTDDFPVTTLLKISIHFLPTETDQKTIDPYKEQMLVLPSS